MGPDIETLDDTVSTEQQELPGILPPFNFERCYLELEAKAAEVDFLHREYEQAASDARDAKKAWDKAAEVYTAMALHFREARRKKAEYGDPSGVFADLAALGISMEPAAINALSEEWRHELDAWLCDAMQHPDERDRWSAALPRALVTKEPARYPKKRREQS